MFYLPFEYVSGWKLRLRTLLQVYSSNKMQFGWL